MVEYDRLPSGPSGSVPTQTTPEVTADARLAEYQPYWAARAELLAKTGAHRAYEIAIGLLARPRAPPLPPSPPIGVASIILTVWTTCERWLICSYSSVLNS